MIAYHFPPFAGSSGVQRTLRFARHLPRFGWEPLILTVHPRAYERVSDDQLTTGGASLPDSDFVRGASRLARTRDLAALLDHAC